MKLMILGAPGAGKGTQAYKICDALNIQHVSTGDMLRKAISQKSDLGLLAEQYINKGELVPDLVILDMVNHIISDSHCSSGFLLDGFPRTLSQAEALDASGIQLDAIIELKVPNEVIVERITGRRTHLSSGRSYHIKFNPPKKEGLDDVTGEPLIQRVDDQEDTIKKRLEIYENVIAEMKNFYKNGSQGIQYISIDGTGELESIYKKILTALNNKK